MKVSKIRFHKTIRTALLIAGSAFCICSCRQAEVEEEETNEGLMTEEAFNFVIVESTNGKLSQRFEAPLTETYGYAREPYREFRKGIKVTKYNSETNEIESTLVADYAINFLNQQLWEAKGNVVATNAKGDKLETQQLFWNQRTQRIYSNIDSKLTQGDGGMIGVGFESDEQFKDWEFRRPRGTVDVDVESTKTPGAGMQQETQEDTEGGISETATNESVRSVAKPQAEPVFKERVAEDTVVAKPMRPRPRRTVSEPVDVNNIMEQSLVQPQEQD